MQTEITNPSCPHPSFEEHLEWVIETHYETQGLPEQNDPRYFRYLAALEMDCADAYAKGGNVSNHHREMAEEFIEIAEAMECGMILGETI